MRRANFLLLIVLSIASTFSALAQEDLHGIVVMSVQRDSTMIKTLIDVANEKLWFQDARYAIDYAEGDFKDEGFEPKWLILGSVDGTVTIRYKETDDKGRVHEKTKNDKYVSYWLIDRSSNTYQKGRIDLYIKESKSETSSPLGMLIDLALGKGGYVPSAKDFMKDIKQHCCCKYPIGDVTGRDKKDRPQYIIVKAGSEDGLENGKKLWLYHDEIDEYGSYKTEMLAKMVVAGIDGPHSCQAEIVSNYNEVAACEDEFGANPLISARTTGKPKMATGFNKVGLKPFTKKSGPKWLPKLAQSHVLYHLIEDGKVRVSFDGKGAAFHVSYEFTNVYFKPVQLEMIDLVKKTKKTVTGKKCYLEYVRKTYRLGASQPMETSKISYQGENGFDENYLIHETMKNWARAQASVIADYAIETFHIDSKCLKVSKSKKNIPKEMILNMGSGTGIKKGIKGIIFFKSSQDEQLNQVGTFKVKEILGNAACVASVKWEKHKPQPDEVKDPEKYVFSVQEWKKKGLF